MAQNENGIMRMLTERIEHSQKHGRTIETDRLQNADGQLGIAAKSLLFEGKTYPPAPPGWDSDYWTRLISKPHSERLIYAGAFLAAEYDRLYFNP